MLARGENNTYACCSINQLSSLEISLSLSKAVLNRCPSCADNFAHLHCITTCSPQQTQTIQVTKVMNVTGGDNVTREAVVAYSAFLSTTFSDASFQSCRNVRIPATGGFAIATMCGRYGAKLCNAQRWYDFQGDSSNGLAPLDIDFHLLKPGHSEELPEGIVPYSGNARSCNEIINNTTLACSCQDCQESCPKIPSPVPPPGPFQLSGIDGFLVVSIILLCVLVVAFFFYLGVAYWVRRKSDGKSKKRGQKSSEVAQKVVHPSEVTCADRNSQLAQDFLSSKFQIWGTIMATYPLTVRCNSLLGSEPSDGDFSLASPGPACPKCPCSSSFKVLLLSAATVAVLAAGLKSIELTTDPVDLWSAPDSRARQEKAFHDTHFDPFFRTNQLILTAPGREGHTYDSLLFGQNNFSGIISKDLIIELLELQKRIQVKSINKKDDTLAVRGLDC